ncbi:MAG: type II toxin-antitoxin system RelE/ParE family toxin [bacterium]|nr:type II toxin-antitoxin system RelE/ParE family toxin [bacterium]
MSYAFHPEAEREFLEAIDYYEAREADLGFDFSMEIYAAVSRAVEHPEAWPILEGEVRRCQTKRFPYGVLYSKEDTGIFVLAVMHLHRAPDYWKHRLV